MKKLKKKHLTQAVILGLLLAVPLGAQATTYNDLMVGYNSEDYFEDNLFIKDSTYNKILLPVDDHIECSDYYSNSAGAYVLKFDFKSDDTIGSESNHVYNAINLRSIEKICSNGSNRTVNMGLGKLKAIYGSGYGISSVADWYNANITLGNPDDDVEDHCLIDVDAGLYKSMGAGIAVSSIKDKIKKDEAGNIVVEKDNSSTFKAEKVTINVHGKQATGYPEGIYYTNVQGRMYGVWIGDNTTAEFGKGLSIDVSNESVGFARSWGIASQFNAKDVTLGENASIDVNSFFMLDDDYNPTEGEQIGDYITKVS